VNENTDRSVRQGAAVHEAGHAVAAWALGLAIRELRISNDGDGTSRIENPTHLPLLQQIALAAAGMEAVELLQASPRPEAGLSDAAKILDLLQHWPEEEREHMQSRGHECARQILADHIDLLTRLSNALFQWGLLDATTLRPVLPFRSDSILRRL
jgi:archaellum biogenesis protein FlaJ (TadC family)